MVGFDSSNSLFDTAEETGGSADAVNVSHTHTATSTVTDPGHSHSITGANNLQGIGSGFNLVGTGATDSTNSATTDISVSTTISSAGSSGTNANYQPYITVYMWKRTA
jgi:microcystin-dependent protein